MSYQNTSRAWLCLAVGIVLSLGTMPTFAQDEKLAPVAETTSATELLDSAISTAVQEPPSLMCQVCEQPRYNLVVRAATTYFDTNDASRVGGATGMTFRASLYEELFAYTSFDANAFSGGMQFTGTLGLLKYGYYSECLRDRIGGSILFDQRTDTRFDDLYLAQMRFRLSYAVSRNLRTGIMYNDPLTGAGVGDVFPGTLPGTVQTSSTVSTYLSSSIAGAALVGLIGYRDDPNTTILGGIVDIPLAERVSVYTSWEYQTEIAGWSGATGLRFRFGPRSRHCGLASYVNHGSGQTNGTVVRGGEENGSLLYGYGNSGEELLDETGAGGSTTSTAGTQDPCHD